MIEMMMPLSLDLQLAKGFVFERLSIDDLGGRQSKC